MELRGPSVLFKLFLVEKKKKNREERERGGGGVSLSLVARLLPISRVECHKELLTLS